MIPHSRPLVGRKELSAVRRVIASGMLAQGNEVARLEETMCAIVGHRHGLAVSSGTMALFAALKALDVGKGDSVVIPSFACTALANAVVMCGAEPAVCDVEYENGLMSVATVEKALTKKTRTIIVPHLFGCPAPAHLIESRLGVPVVEDCAQCVGTTIDGRTVGSLTSIAAFSFYATKVLCAGEGGLAAATDSRLSRRLEDMREYDNLPTWEPRCNLKLSDVNAAIAHAQLERLPHMLRRRAAIARRYCSALAEGCGAKPFPATNNGSMFFRFLLRVPRRRRASAMRHFTECGIACVRPIYKPFHRYMGIGCCPNTDRLYDELISIPIYPALTAHQAGDVAMAIAALRC